MNTDLLLDGMCCARGGFGRVFLLGTPRGWTTVIANGRPVSILTATSLHWAQADAWAMTEPIAQHTLERLLQLWRQDGLPGRARFDNDSVFQGTQRREATLH